MQKIVYQNKKHKHILYVEVNDLPLGLKLYGKTRGGYIMFYAADDGIIVDPLRQVGPYTIPRNWCFVPCT